MCLRNGLSQDRFVTPPSGRRIVQLPGSSNEIVIVCGRHCDSTTDMRSFDISNDRLGVLHGLTKDSTPLPARNTVEPEVLNPPPKPQSSPHSPPHAGSDKIHESSRSEKGGNQEGVEKRSKRKFRFKKKHRPDREEEERHYRRRDSLSRPSKRPRHTHHANEVKDDPAAYDDTYIPNAASFKYANSDDAFRESLFDAMADDEGAAFWEGVYGQPINVYDRPEVEGERGELEMMDDEQYAKHVREKMWEKSHQHIIEERAERERERENAKERKRRDEEARRQWEQAEKTRLKEGKQRSEMKARNQSHKRWGEYLENWTTIMEGTQVDVNDGGKKAKGYQPSIPWPVQSGELSDISRETVEQFFLSALTSTKYRSRDFINILKLERVRWHPDKAQQRWGKGGLGEEEVKGITAVFQAIDSLWIEYRLKE